jgi:hypothetical protein
MKWNEIRKNYPECWVLIEALKAHSKKGIRYIDEISVIDTFKDSPLAMKEYDHLHREMPLKEFYVLHTSRTNIEIPERIWLGIRSG